MSSPCPPHGRIFRRAVLIGLALVLQAPVLAAGGIFGYVDEDGVEHFSNVPDSKRYRLLLPDRLAPAQAALRSQRGIHALPLAQRPFHDLIRAVSNTTGIDVALLHAVITVESGYRADAVSPKGATGLMQLLPATARRYGTDNPHDPGANIAAGARYLSYLLRLFDNDLELALGAYNAGEGAVLRHGRRLPPYGETRRYVPLVLAHYQKLAGREAL